jgi:isopentenyl diphosphate isomerase/L-lactate dehydrogenase-like FMN-dependent dehydrogenase
MVACRLDAGPCGRLGQGSRRQRGHRFQPWRTPDGWCRSSIGVLPEVVAQVERQIEVHPDSGIRSGQGVLRSLTLGARVCIGQPFLHGLGAPGEKSVATCLDLMRREFYLTMAFCGVSHLGQVNSAILRRFALEGFARPLAVGVPWSGRQQRSQPPPGPR